MFIFIILVFLTHFPTIQKLILISSLFVFSANISEFLFLFSFKYMRTFLNAFIFSSACFRRWFPITVRVIHSIHSRPRRTSPPVVKEWCIYLAKLDWTLTSNPFPVILTANLCDAGVLRGRNCLRPYIYAWLFPVYIHWRYALGIRCLMEGDVDDGICDALSWFVILFGCGCV